MQLASRRATSFGAAFLALALFAPTHRAAAQADPEVLSNTTVVQMVAGKLSKDLIIGKINSARPGFDLSSDGITSLVNAKVDQNIIKLMIQAGDNARRSGSAPSSLTGLDEVLTNEIVVRMLNNKVPKQLVMQKIQISRSSFDVSAAGLVSLNNSKVPDEVIKAMMVPPMAQPAASNPVREAPPPPAPAPAAAATDKKATPAPAKGKAAAKDSTKKKPPAASQR